MMRLKRQSGFTMVELMITMIIFLVVIAAVSNIFVGLLSNFKQQSKLAETSIEGMVGLKMLKADVELAGYGLPFFLGGATYANEAVDETKTDHDVEMFNDAPNNVPRAVLTAAGGYNNSDIFTVKSSAYGMSGTSQKWAYITNVGGTVQLKSWKNLEGSDIVDENLQSGDNVIVMKPVSGKRQKILIRSGAKFYDTFPVGTNFSPDQDTETYLLYGLTTPGTTPRMPFNRADFYVRRPAAGMPSQCQGAASLAANSPGILYKAIVNHSNGNSVEYPLLDCVATMRMVMMVDTDDDDATPPTAVTAGAWPTAATTAEQIRNQLKEIRLYIVAQEGQRDAGYQSPAAINISDPDFGPLLPAYAVPDRNYRWRTYTVVIKPYNLR